MNIPMARKVRLLPIALFWASFVATSFAGPPRRLAVREIQPQAGAAAPFLFRPVSVVCDKGSVYVLDSADADIKVYSRDGAFRRTIGRKGQGPAEFRLPNDLDVFGGRLYVADSANRRLQILDAGGRLLGGFGVGMTPWRILVLGDDRILVAALPSGRARGEKLIVCFRRDGTLDWQAVDSLQSGDSVYDALMNQVFLKRSPGGRFRLIRLFDDRIIRTMASDGSPTEDTPAPEAGLPFKDIVVPTANGQKRTLRGFCWSCAADGRRLYLLSPEYTDDHDLGPGRVIAVLDESLDLEALIELPEKITDFAVAGNTIYAIDTDSSLRLFRFDPIEPSAAPRLGSAPTDRIRIVANLEEAAAGPVRLAVLVFFALDCPVCWEELFEVRYVVEKQGIPADLIGISADTAAELEPFLGKHAFFYPVVSDRGRKLFRRFRVRLEPFVVVLDGDRVIYQDNTSEGMDTRRENLKRCLLEISAKRSS